MLTAEEENKRIEQMNQHYEQEKLKHKKKKTKLKKLFKRPQMKSVNLLHLKGFLYRLYKMKWIGQLSNICLKIKWNKKLFMRICESKLVKLQLDKREVVENSAKARDKVIEDAKKTRDDKIAYAIRLRMSQELLIKKKRITAIAEANRQYNSTVSTARDKHKEIVGEAKSQAGEHANQVDWETGQIKSKYQVMKDDVVQKMKETWSGITKWWEETKLPQATR